MLFCPSNNILIVCFEGILVSSSKFTTIVTGEEIMIISKKKRESEEFKKLFCTAPNEGELAREDIKRILLNACARTEQSVEIIEEEDSFDFSINDMYELDVTDEEVAEYIVENPKEVVVNFPLTSNVQMEEKLPFFKSIMYKLANA